MKTAFLFPGQGAQQLGMGKDLYEAFPAAKGVFDRAEGATHLPLRKLCFEGPAEELARTDICQPAIFTVSAAVLAVIRDLLGPERTARFVPDAMAGLSLGEYTALYLAGSMGLEDALKLVTHRGQAMQQAATAVPSGMVSVLGLDEPKARELCLAAADGEVLVCANFNCPGQIVLSGQIGACRRAEAMAKRFGASGAVALKVAGAFHSPLMKPAADALAGALENVAFKDPGVPVVANVDALPYNGADQIRPKLLAQLTGAVRWQQCARRMLDDGIERFYEIGPGRVLAGLMRRMDRKAHLVSVNSRESVEKLVKVLGR
jgi:[acyl-carrier-protein] S-malonyltransferase